MFTSVDDLKVRIQENHTNQRLRYWFDIQLGYVLRNIETDERIQFYPSDNTSFFNVNDLPIVNTSIDRVLNQLDGDDLLEKLKRPNSKWSVESIYEYVLLTTPLPEVPIGSSMILPDFIKNSKSIASFQNVSHKLCFWDCFARPRYPEIRLDRLSTKAKDLYKDYYKIKGNKNYSGVDIQELVEIEDYFIVNINIKKYLQLLYPKYFRFFGMISHLEDENIKKRLRAQLLEWLDILSFYGFNSSSYDINVIKKYLPDVLMKHKRNMEMYQKLKSFGFVQLKKI